MNIIYSIILGVTLILAVASCTNYIVIDGNNYEELMEPVQNLKLKNTSQINFLRGSEIISAKAFDKSHCHVFEDSNVVYFHGFDESSLEVKGGNITYVNLHDSAHSKIKGGVISWIRTFDRSTVHLKHIEELTWLVAADKSQIHIYARSIDIAENLLTGNWENDRIFTCNRVSGIWENGNPFNFWVVFVSEKQSNTFSSKIKFHPLRVQ